MKKIILEFVLLFVCMVPLLGQVKGGDIVYSFAAIKRSPVNMAKGFTGLNNTDVIAWSSFVNSALIPMSYKKMDISIVNQFWAPNGVKSNNFGIGGAYKITDKLGFSIALIRQTGEKYNIVGESGYKKGSFIPTETQIGAGIGYRIMKYFSIGINLKRLSSNLAPETNFSAFMTDIHLMYIKENLSVSIGSSNLGSKVKDGNGRSFNLPTSVDIGGAYNFIKGVHKFIMSSDIYLYVNKSLNFSLGGEYCYNDLIFTRLGYNWGVNDSVLPSFLTLGVGVKFMGISLDVAYITANKALGNTVSFGLGYSF